MRHFLLLIAAFLFGCSTSSITAIAPEPYKIEIQQGNVITQEMVERLRPGMTRAQVRFVLGTPPIADMFHARRWDYVYRLSRGGRLVEERKLTLFFEDDQLVRVAGDVVPLEAEGGGEAADRPAARAVSEIVLDRADPDAPPAPPPEQKGFFGRVLENIGF